MKIRTIVMTGVAAVAVYFAVFGGEYSVFAVWRMDREAEREQAALAATRQEIEALRAHADSLATDAVVERIAREEFGMIRPGERLYRFAEVPETDVTEDLRGSR